MLDIWSTIRSLRGISRARLAVKAVEHPTSGPLRAVVKHLPAASVSNCRFDSMSVTEYQTVIAVLNCDAALDAPKLVLVVIMNRFRDKCHMEFAAILWADKFWSTSALAAWRRSPGNVDGSCGPCIRSGTGVTIRNVTCRPTCQGVLIEISETTLLNVP